MGRPRRSAEGGAPPDVHALALDASERLLAEWGYAGVSMDDVAKATGVTKAALYYHFPSKHALVLAVAKRAIERDQRDLQVLLAGKHTPTEQLGALIGAMLSAHQRPHQALHQKLRDAARFLPEAYQAELYEMIVETVPRRIEDLLRVGVEQGDFRPHDTALMAWVLAALLGELANLPPQATSPNAANQIADFVMKGVGRRREGGP